MNSHILYPKPTRSGQMQQLTVAASPTTLDTTKFGIATCVAWSLEGGSARVTFDGSAPSATAGFPLSAGTTGTWSAATAEAAKLYATAGTPVLTAQPFTE